MRCKSVPSSTSRPGCGALTRHTLAAILRRLARPPTDHRRQIPGRDFGSRKEARRLAEVRVGENETFESALRRFNKKIQQSGILAEARRREHYEKPSVKRKRKEAKKRKATRI
jgi:small subunit ribosomal protein S21